jgi:hypothetical protein
MRKIFVILHLFIFSSPSYLQTLDIYSSDLVSLHNDTLLAQSLVKAMNDSVAYVDTADGMMAGSAGIEDGYFTYAPDNSFKILSITGFYCGAYCNADYYNYFFYSIGGNELMHELNIGNVYDIFEIKNPAVGKEYLILTRTFIRPRGVETISQESLYHLRITGTVFELIPITILSDESEQAMDGFMIEESVICSDNSRPSNLKHEIFIQVLQDGKRVRFQTFDVHEYDLKDGEDVYCTLRAGELEYRKGSFFQKECEKNIPRSPYTNNIRF